MPYPNRKGAARLKIEAFLAAQTGPLTAVSIRHGTGLQAQQVANALTGMRLDGQLAISGKPPSQGYQLIVPGQPAKPPTPPKQAAWAPDSKKAWAPPAPKPEAEVIYPPGYRHTVSAAPEIHRGSYRGTNWPGSAGRPDRDDSLRVPSRRGDDLVQHRSALGMQTGNPRGSAYHLVPAEGETKC